MGYNADEEVPVTSSFDLNGLSEDKTYTKDESEQSTLHRQYEFLRAEMAKLDTFHVFDLNETDMKIKQQIKAHRMTYDILEPILESFETALSIVDEKFRARNRK